MNRDEPSPAQEPLAWQNRVGFHAALLLHFNGDGAAAMRRVGQLVYDMAIQTEPPYDPDEENPTVRECRAALADLELLRDYLGCIGQKGSHPHSGPAGGQALRPGGGVRRRSRPHRRRPAGRAWLVKLRRRSEVTMLFRR